jgi:spore photoproduct lyase
VEDVLHILDEVFRDHNEPILFNSGELADSLMSPNRIKRIMDKFEQQNKHKLLLLTKSTNVEFILQRPRKQTIISFSINAPVPARLWEHHVPPPEHRIKAAKMVSDAGYEIRIRIDPMVPIIHWKRQYIQLVDEIFRDLCPNRITLGTLRGLQKTIMFCMDRSWVKYLSEKKTGWGRKIAFDKRRVMYSTIISYLEKEYNYIQVALCKETLKIWKEIGLEPGISPYWRKCRCNCVL